MKNLTTQHVVIIVSFLACVTVLAIVGRETGALIAVGVAILGAAGLQLGQTIAVKENTNGTNQALMEFNRKSQEEAAANAARTLEILEANQRAIVSLAHKMGTMTDPAQLALVRSDQDKRAA